ncbi:TPA: hypothetical protein ACK02A_002879, partial [Staphylococcus aureus]
VVEASHINGIRVTIPAGNSYPYYQDKKKLVFNSFQKPFKNLSKTINPQKYHANDTQNTRLQLKNT